MSKLWTFLFDCDGTLFDTESLKAESWGRGMLAVIKSKGWLSDGASGEEAIVGQIMGMYRAGGTTQAVAEEILGKCKRHFTGKLGEFVNAVSVNDLKVQRKEAKGRILQEKSPALIEPVWNLVLQVKREEEYKVGLVTTTTEPSVQGYFAGTKVQDHNQKVIGDPGQFFDVMVCGKEKGIGVKEAICRLLRKLAPDEPVDDLTIAERFDDLPPADVNGVVLVEDSPEGTQAGKATGVCVITVPNDFTKGSFPHLLLSQTRLGQMSLQQVLAELERNEAGARWKSARGD